MLELRPDRRGNAIERGREERGHFLAVVVRMDDEHRASVVVSTSPRPMEPHSHSEDRIASFEAQLRVVFTVQVVIDANRLSR